MSRYNKNYARYILDDYSDKIQVFLPTATTNTTQFDKYRNVGATHGSQNYLTVKGFVRDITTNELIIKQIGLVAVGAKKIVVKNNDVALFKIAIKILINNEEFYVFNDSVGSKMIIKKLDANYSEIVAYKKEI